MNYILTLQHELSAARAALRAKAEIIAAFRRHLAGPKFHGVDLDGERKDWIATADVHAWLEQIADADASDDSSPAPNVPGPP